MRMLERQLGYGIKGMEDKNKPPYRGINNKKKKYPTRKRDSSAAV